MKFDALLATVGDLPAFETGLLLAGDVDPTDIRRQLSLWVKAGRLYQLRRGLYALAPPYRKINPHPFVIANSLVPGSYVSLHSALAYYNLIPEGVAVVTSVCARRPGSWQTPLGVYEFRHVSVRLLYGYRRLPLGNGQEALAATPEKALLDLIHLTAGADAPAYLRELRLQNLDRLDLATLQRQAEHSNSPKLLRAATYIAALARDESEDYTAI